MNDEPKWLEAEEDEQFASFFEARAKMSTFEPVITVNRRDLEAVLEVVPEWVPEGARGEMDWTPESLEAKDRLQKTLDEAGRVPRQATQECGHRQS